MSRLILLLFFAACVAAQIDDGCINCGLPDHPNCQVRSRIISGEVSANISSGVSAQQVAGGVVLLLNNSKLETW